MKKTILFAVSCFAVLSAGCLPQQKLAGRVMDASGPMPGAAVLAMVWIEDAGRALPAPSSENLDQKELDAALEKDMKDRGLPMAYARAFTDENGVFVMDKLHFSAETKKAVKAMKQPKITRITLNAFQRGYLKHMATTFPTGSHDELFPAVVRLPKPESWKQLALDNYFRLLRRPEFDNGYSKEYGATKEEKKWFLDYVSSNLNEAYQTSNIKGDKQAEDECGRDFSDVVVSTAGMQRNPAREKCNLLLHQMGVLREWEKPWVNHAYSPAASQTSAIAAIQEAVDGLGPEYAEIKQYEAQLIDGAKEAESIYRKNSGNNGLRNGLNEVSVLPSDAKGLYVSGDKAGGYGALGYSLYYALPGDLKQGMATAVLLANVIPKIRETACGFYLLMNKPLTAQLPNGDGNHKDKPAAKAEVSTDTVKENSVPIEEYVPKVIIEGKWGTGPGEFGRQGDVDYDLKPESLAVDSKGNIYILDFVNNRIQKYSGEGVHLKDIAIDGLRGPVECWAVKRYDETMKKEIWSVGATSKKPENVPDSNLQAYIWPPEIRGINIAIDSKDTLYYYLKRIKDGKETGEVWEFRKDKQLKKTPQKLRSEPGAPLAKYVETKFDADVKEDSINRKYGAVDSKKRELKFRLNAGEELYGKRKVFFDESTGEWNVRIKKTNKVWYKKYDSAGKLLSISEVPVLSEHVDSKGNYYFLETDAHGLKIRKNELTRTLK